MDLTPHIEVVARRLLGKPTSSSKTELRYGSHGSLSVDLKKATWFDHELNVGGGVLDLVARETGCANGDAVRWLNDELGIQVAETLSPTKRPCIVETYDYHDKSGAVVMQVCRFDPKDFRQRRPDGRGGWVWSVKGVEPIPYRLPQLLKAVDEGKEVLVVEGEKDADRLAATGVTATCNPGGAGKWPASFAQYFRGARVVLVPDNDKAGRSHMRTVALTLGSGPQYMMWLDLIGLPEKGDVSDWLDAPGRSAEDINDALADARAVDIADLPHEQEDEPQPVAKVGRLRFDLLDSIEPALNTSDFVEGLLLDGQLSLLYGESGTGKTFFATDIALHVALGWKWRDRQIERGAVLYIAAEGGFGVRNRIAAFRSRHDVTTAPFAVAPTTIDLLNNDNDGDAGAVVEAIADLQAATGYLVKMVVVDTLSRALAGGDENSSADMGALVSNIDQIRAQTGVHVMLVHHSGKDTSKGARGHSLLRAAVDTEIEVQRPEGEKVGTAKVRKQRDLECTGRFGYRLEPVELGANDRGMPITSCVVMDVAASSSARASIKLSDEQRAFMREVKTALTDNGETVVPERGMSPVIAVARNHLRNRLIQGGIVDGAAASNRISANIQSYLTKLKGKQLLGVTKDYVWLVE
ncbi:MAG: AAA family ATPase [Alphaproteobacteria bacterium]|nr:AAA family ATPase [Alphaproteobacteria bacterium]